MYFYFGDKVLREGLKSYFGKYAFKNTELKDFLFELGAAAKTLGIKDDLVAWSNVWLKTSGLNVIRYTFEETDNVIRKFELH